MFEDSTFASTGRVRMRTRAGFYAAFAFEGIVVMMMVLIPLLYPHALPNMVSKFLVDAPMPVEQPKPQAQHASAARAVLAMMDSGIHAPRLIPDHIYIPDSQEPRVDLNASDFADPHALAGGGNPFGSGPPTVRVAPADTPRTIRVPSVVSAGMLLRKVLPVYPPIAVASHTQGTVVLQATISRTGVIENLHVVSGSPMLQQAALEAVSQWRYRPYMLNGRPIEVETTVNVVFRVD